jgi:hypothetical protein
MEKTHRRETARENKLKKTEF